MHLIADPSVKAVTEALRLHLPAQEPFVAYKGKLTGCPTPTNVSNWSGDLFGELGDRLVPALVGALPRYIVWSYGTPIAWLASDAAFLAVPPRRAFADAPAVPDERPVWALSPLSLSATSDRHQDLVEDALRAAALEPKVAEGWAA